MVRTVLGVDTTASEDSLGNPPALGGNDIDSNARRRQFLLARSRAGNDRHLVRVCSRRQRWESDPAWASATEESGEE